MRPFPGVPVLSEAVKRKLVITAPDGSDTAGYGIAPGMASGDHTCCSINKFHDHASVNIF
jgi:hypothetical protein